MSFLTRIKQALGLAVVVVDETEIVDNENSPVLEPPQHVSSDIADELLRLQQNNLRLSDENRRLKTDLERANLSNERQRQALLNRINDLQSQVISLEEQKEALLVSQISRQITGENVPADGSEPAISPDKEALIAARKEILRLTTLNEQLDVKSRISDKMMADLNAKANTARREAERLASELQSVDELKTQMEKIEDIIKRKDNQIAALQEQVKNPDTQNAELASLREKTDRLSNEREQLRRTIETNLYNQAHSESRLRQRIKELEKRLDLLSDPNAEAPAQKKTRKEKSKSKESGISLTPEDPANASVFGYQEPSQKNQNDDPAQLTLF
ncbi:MAG: hypothetical protein HUK13_00780 [Muribaculaceae bacterium]|nr:hypothetical protein [Muribaculaceae bacterium]